MKKKPYISNRNKIKIKIKSFRISTEDNDKLEKILKKEWKTLSEFVREIIRKHF